MNDSTATSKPVSSFNSRIAVSSGVSPNSIASHGNPHLPLSPRFCRRTLPCSPNNHPPAKTRIIFSCPTLLLIQLI